MQDSNRQTENKRLLKQKWQTCKDSNLNKVNQNHLCYRYTTGLQTAYNILPDSEICKLFLQIFTKKSAGNGEKRKIRGFL